MSKIKKTAASNAGRKAFVPDTATVDHGHEYPRVPKMPPFVLVYNPRRWMVLGGEVVPRLHQVPLAEGVNQVTRNRNGAWELAAFRTRLERQGRTLIPWNTGPDGSYVAVVETRLEQSGRVVDTYIPSWAQTFAGSTELRADTGAYVGWLQSLMASGVLPKPPPHVIESLLRDAKKEQRVAALEAKRHETAANLQRLESLENEIAALEKAYKAIQRKPTAKRAAAPAVAE